MSDIRGKLKKCCQQSIQKFKSVKRIAGDAAEPAAKEENKDEKDEVIETKDGNADNSKSKVKSMLIGDSTNFEMPYTQEAAIKSHNNRLRKFIKLIDYMVADSKFKLSVQATKKLTRTIADYNRYYQDPNKPFYGMPSWMVVEVGQIKGSP